ncbi:CcdC family protein [Pseudogracilibacillus auburnensis]|uniref:Membrane protein CcdC involved in cytochrome C biogenesis n=1 Tax=Pseudogracilibacillus auburnensis TaxID=1494959 RepID=A0A2V3W8W5_9BACI|nr:cytochrome c biogenesis protein CcdC [Pseudogracilibacillus auburnensis]PXW85159.1 membrane protein CcdC involved in cytochrome C biogenesis [Pseudogracilibacillus auburnensis]
MNNTLLIVGSTIVAIFMAVTMILIRIKTAQKPTSVKRIILPPIFMSSGALMFIFPAFRLGYIQIFEALIVGIIFSIFLIKTTTFEMKQQQIYLIPSRSFIFILFGLLGIRIVIKLIVGSTISFEETSGMFFLLAFGMIISWRIAMLYKYIQLKNKVNVKQLD